MRLKKRGVVLRDLLLVSVRSESIHEEYNLQLPNSVAFLSQLQPKKS